MREDGEENPHFDTGLPPDVMTIILSMLPARSFAASACTCRSWNRLCARVLSRPKLLSALSLRTTLQDAVDEACNTILSEPITPHFVISYVGRNFYLEEALRLLKVKLGYSIPMIVCCAPGIIGRNAQTKEFNEVLWGHEESYPEGSGSSSESQDGFGLVLTIGFVPGLKVAVMPVRCVDQETIWYQSFGVRINLKWKASRKREFVCQSFSSPADRKGGSSRNYKLRLLLVCNTQSLIDMYLTSIKNYAESVSGSSCPAGIIMFAGEGCDNGCGITYFLEKMDESLSNQNHRTPVAGCLLPGHIGVQFLFDGCEYLTHGSQYNNMESSQSSTIQAKHVGTPSQESVMFDIVGLIFAKDKDKPCRGWEIQFNVAISHGLSPVGPTFKAASVRHVIDRTSGSFTWITARKEGSLNLDGNSLFNDLENEIGNEKARNAFYVIIEKKRKHAISSRKRKIVTSFALHEITGADEEYLYVRGSGIRTGDAIHFCALDGDTAYASRADVMEKFMHLKGEISTDRDKQDAGNGLQVFGGMIFACAGRGEPFFHRPGIDSSTFLDVFSDASLAGAFCMGEIGPSLMETVEENRCCLMNRYSSVFLVMACKPKCGSQVKDS